MSISSDSCISIRDNNNLNVKVGEEISVNINGISNNIIVEDIFDVISCNYSSSGHRISTFISISIFIKEKVKIKQNFIKDFFNPKFRVTLRKLKIPYFLYSPDFYPIYYPQNLLTEEELYSNIKSNGLHELVTNEYSPEEIKLIIKKLNNQEKILF
jgi:hypothetical protein